MDVGALWHNGGTLPLPQLIPVIVLGRLAVDRRWRGKGIGAGLLKDAVLRSIQVTQEIAARALLVHAISEPARKFYLKFGFVESPDQSYDVDVQPEQASVAEIVIIGRWETVGVSAALPTPASVRPRPSP